MIGPRPERRASAAPPAPAPATALVPEEWLLVDAAAVIAVDAELRRLQAIAPVRAEAELMRLLAHRPRTVIAVPGPGPASAFAKGLRLLRSGDVPAAEALRTWLRRHPEAAAVLVAAEELALAPGVRRLDPVRLLAIARRARGGVSRAEPGPSGRLPPRHPG